MSKVLIIDDEPIMLEFLASLIQRLGYEVTAAGNVAEARSQTVNPEYKAVISDVYMPSAPPPAEWIRELRQLCGTRHLILISGAPSDELVAAAKENHVTEFLSKPFELAFIKAVLNRVLK